MNQTQMIDAIRSVLADKMQIVRIAAFNQDARLNEDLYLDSVLILQLLVHIELDLGIEIPDQALSKDDFTSIADLARFLTQLGEQQQAEQAAEFEDIKVHCYVSCLCEQIKASQLVDHRPFYFGVWDAEVFVDQQAVLSYHSDTVDHGFFRDWYQQLYGVRVQSWYDEALSKRSNVERLVELLQNKPADRNVMVMLDMYQLPERENKFNKNPFPHYVMLSADIPADFALTDEQQALQAQGETLWYMLDPDFRWQGVLPKSRILQAVEQPSVAGGYYFDASDIQLTQVEVIDSYYQTCMQLDHNPFTSAIRCVVDAHVKGRQALANLGRALEEIPVLAIRKYAYEHGFAYFFQTLGWDDVVFEIWCDEIAKLVETYTVIQHRAIKLAISQDLAIQTELYQLLDQQDRLERKIKVGLDNYYQAWCKQVLSAPVAVAEV